MKSNLNRTALATGLSKIQNVVGGKTTLPVLSHVLLRFSKERLELAATDLDITITTALACNGGQEGALAIPCKKLSAITNAMGSEDILTEGDGKGRFKIEAGASRYNLLGLPATEFPPVVLPIAEPKASTWIRPR